MRPRPLFFSSALSFGFDQLTKGFVLYRLNLEESLHIDIFPPFITFQMGWNTGINFGLFSQNLEVMRWILVAIALIIPALLFLWGQREFHRPLQWVLLGMVIGGSLGNVLDRIRYGAVVDFLNLTCCAINNPYIFNFADVFIFIGIFGLLFTGFNYKSR